MKHSREAAYWNRCRPESVAVMGRSVQLGLFVDRKSLDLLRVERVVACQMRPIRHAANARFGNVDRLEPNADFAGAEAAKPLAWRPAVAGSARRLRLAGTGLHTHFHGHIRPVLTAGSHLG